MHHYDLYRLQGADPRLDLAASFANAVSLVEWPERLPPSVLPADHLLVAIQRLDEVPAKASVHICSARHLLSQLCFSCRLKRDSWQSSIQASAVNSAEPPWMSWRTTPGAC